MGAKYLLQRRSLEGFRPRPLGGSQMTYSKWITRKKFDTEADALDALHDSKGFYSFRVAYRGKTVQKKR